MNYKIIADSSCELSSDIAEKLDIEILPVIITLDDKQFLDNIDIQPSKIFEDMKNGLVYKTSQISLNTYINTFKKYAQKNIPVINVVMSSGISSSYETSKIAVNMVKEEYKDAQIYTVDSKCCSLEMGIAVYNMALAAKNGKTYGEIIDVLEYCKNNTTVLFSVDDLKYLQRGGRISKASAIIGNTLGIKPILTVTNDGKLQVKDKVRSRKKLLSYIVDTFEKDIEKNEMSKIQIVISNAVAQDTVDELKDMMIEKFSLDNKQFWVQETGATIGVHTGPQSLYVFYLRKNVPDNMIN